MTVVLGGVLGLASVGPAIAADVTKQRLENADKEPQNWLTVFQNYSSHHFSALTQVNRDNVKNLKVAFTVPLTSALTGKNTLNLENAPLVDDGFMYVDDGWGGIYKIDLHEKNAGAIVWFADPAVSKDEDPRTRGISMWGNNVYKDLIDGRVIAVNRDTGEIVFDKQVARVDRPGGAGADLIKGEGFSAAPLAVEGKILVGQAWGDRASRGWLAALDANNGDVKWLSYTIPGPGEPGHETWKDDHNAWKTGGASLWTTGSYDPAQRVTIWGTAQPVPMFDPEFRPGDNLYSNSAMAWDIDTGKLKWYFQYTPNESWDFDEQGVHMLIDATVNGEARKMVAHFGRNGFFYKLDRTNGGFLDATQFVAKVTWTKGIDPKTGKPMEYDPTLALQRYIPEARFKRGDDVKQTCPTLVGGVRWQPPSYNAAKHVAYAGAIDGCFALKIMATLPVSPAGGIRTDQGGGNNGRGTNVATYPVRNGLIAAVDVTTNKLTTLKTPYDNLSGITATAGGLIFTGTLDGAITAHNDDTLQELWRFKTNISIKAPVISFAVDGKQYLAVVTGGSKAPQADVFPELKNMNSGAMLYVFTL
jgi:alcohol dehydrogenase (cytochrome c)